MSAKTKSTSKSTSKKTATTADEITATVAEMIGEDVRTVTPEELDAAATDAAKAARQPKKYRFYEVVIDPGTNVKTRGRRGQSRTVIQAITDSLADGKLELDTPYSTTDLRTVLCDLILSDTDKYKYKVRAGGGDLAGSVAFHLHQLGRQFPKDGGFLRAFDCTRAADGAGWVEVDEPVTEAATPAE